MKITKRNSPLQTNVHHPKKPPKQTVKKNTLREIALITCDSSTELQEKEGRKKDSPKVPRNL